MISLLIAHSLAGVTAAQQINREVVYRVGARAAPTSRNAFSFVESKKWVSSFNYAYGVAPESVPKIFRSYRYAEDVHSIGIDFNHISVPRDIEKSPAWNHFGDRCEARHYYWNEPDEYVIKCDFGSFPESQSSVFKYSPKKGVTGFYANCYFAFTCWFELQSEQGILKAE